MSRFPVRLLAMAEVQDDASTTDDAARSRLPTGAVPDRRSRRGRRLVQRLEDAGYDHLLVYDHVLGADITNRPDWTGYYDSARPVPRTARAVRVPRPRVLTRARDRRARAAAAPDRAGGQAGRDARPPRARPHPPRRGHRVERRRVPGARDRLPQPCGAHGGADPAAAPALDRAERRPRRRVGGDRCRRPRAAAARTGADLDRVRHRQPRPWRASGASPTGGCRSPRSNPAAASNRRGLEVRAAAAAAGRDPDALGLEGQVWSPPDQEDRLPDRLARWRDAGADAVGINTGRAGVPWSDEHLDALLRAADARP